MTHDQFWQIIADSRRDFDPGRRDGNMDLQTERLEQLLTVMPADEVQEFDRIFTQLFFDAHRWDLWAAAYIIEGGCSDDGFMDFRFWLISMGREVYEAAMADAESLAEVAAGPGIEMTRFQDFGLVAAPVLEAKGIAEPDYRHPENPVGERWTDDDLPERFPKLWARFGEAEHDPPMQWTEPAGNLLAVRAPGAAPARPLIGVTLSGSAAATRMSTPMPPVDEKVVRQLHELADTPFAVRAFRDRWQAFGWTYDPHTDDRFGFRVRVDGERALMVDPLGGEVLCASLSLSYWEEYQPQWHEERAEFERQRAAYDAAFDAAANVARRVLPPPLAAWTDADADAHIAVVWGGTHGLLVLQQAAFDTQFGLELNFWLARSAADGFRPTTPLIDWLCQLSRREHDARGFPPLPW